jgi:urease accessory protein
MSERARPPKLDPQRARALLQVWLSPSFPVGGYAYSQGLEKAVEMGWITGRASLSAWLAYLVTHGSLRNELILLAAAHRAMTAGEIGSIREVAELSIALQPTAERHLEATQQGRSFLAQIDAAWPLSADTRSLFGGATPSLAVALGVTAAGHAVPLDDTLIAFALAWTGALTSAAIRLSVIGQTDGQRITSELFAALAQAATAAAASTLEDLGSATFAADIASMQHEIQYTRLFRS